MNRIKYYFNLIAEQLDVKYRQASTSGNRSNIGYNREKFIEIFLQKHLPKRLFAFLGDRVIGLRGESDQIDIIVSNDISIRFEENERNFITAESVAAAITVKSYLDKAAIQDCLSNLASIPQFSPDILSFKALKTGAFERFIEKHPSLYIFAYDGVNEETCLDHIMEFYNVHCDIPRNRWPLGIIVNKKYIIKHVREPTAMLDGTPIPAPSIYPFTLEESNWGWPFIHLIDDITSYVSWLSYMNIQMEHYFNSAYFVEENQTPVKPEAEQGS